MNPRFPIFIPSKGRWEPRITMRHLDGMRVPYRVIVEEQEHEKYAQFVDPAKLLVLDPAYFEKYDTCDPEGDAKGVSRGSGVARNFAWDVSISEGHSHHWIMDDNLMGFFRLNRHRKHSCGDGSLFYIMEDFALRFRNVGMAGPNYVMFTPNKQKHNPIIVNTRIFSCNLIRNDLPFRWRGRFNEDAILSLDMLKAGWCTILFNAFVQQKMHTQRIKGGNTEVYQKEGTYAKSLLLKKTHPDVTKIVWKWGRWHHYVDYSVFTTKLLPNAKITAPAVDEYGLVLVDEPYEYERFI